MKLTVLGNNGPYPKAGGACSGYLIEEKDTKVLLDCGNGVVSRLFQKLDVDDIDAIILSHLHSDHISDIFVLKYAIGIRRLKKNFAKSIPLYLPMDDDSDLENINYNEAFEINPIAEEMPLAIKDLVFNFKEMTHPVKTYGVKVTNKENNVFVYSGDTSYNEGLIDFAFNADLFLCEAGVLEKDRGDETPHLSARQSGQIASKANVKRLILTHFWPEYRLDRIFCEAKSEYDSVLELSEDMKEYYV